MLEKFHRKYIGDRNFYKRYIALALPMIMQNAVTNLVSFLDNIMVGQLGTEQMSGVAIVNQLIFVYNLAVFGAVSAASIFGAQYFGKGNLAVVVGSLQMRTWETDKGEKRRVYEVIASEIKFGGDKKETSKDTSPKGEPDEEEEDTF